MEFPHLLELMRQNQFDTIYHEHFSYFSFTTVSEVFRRHGLRLFDVERCRPTAARCASTPATPGTGPAAQRARAASCWRSRRSSGCDRLETYTAFAEQVRETKRALLEFLIAAKRAGKRIVGYGAPGKGNTLLNYCGIGTDFLDFTVDRNPYKQGKYTPGSHIPIRHPDALLAAQPDYILILPWNLQGGDPRHRRAALPGLRAQFVVPIPRVEVVGGAGEHREARGQRRDAGVQRGAARGERDPLGAGLAARSTSRSSSWMTARPTARLRSSRSIEDPRVWRYALKEQRRPVAAAEHRHRPGTRALHRAAGLR